MSLFDSEMRETGSEVCGTEIPASDSALPSLTDSRTADARLSPAGLIPSVRLYLAEHEGECIAAIITLFSPRQAVYLYGASSNIKRNLMATYLLQWQAITDAKDAGSRIYDFYGISPTDDKHHPMHGLYRFKTNFGGTIIHRPGSIDAVVSPVYRLYCVMEKVRMFYHKRIKKFLRMS
jgi:lipid II:glycine glycyltransferase (peptidoglycan interpeptide bridge formation enzyme)